MIMVSVCKMHSFRTECCTKWIDDSFLVAVVVMRSHTPVSSIDYKKETIGISFDNHICYLLRRMDILIRTSHIEVPVFHNVVCERSSTENEQFIIIAICYRLQVLIRCKCFALETCKVYNVHRTLYAMLELYTILMSE